MTLWLILSAMGAVVAAVLFLGLRLKRPRPRDTAEHDLAVYRAQLDELERDRERGVLDDAELGSARLEVQRRLLAADASRRPRKEAGPQRVGWALPLALALAVPLAGGALYLRLGDPGVASQPFAERQHEPVASADAGNAAPDVSAMMARLRDRLARQPDDVEGWIMLGRSAAVLGNYDESIDAYKRALALDGKRGDVYSALGEVHVLAAGGIVTEAAQAALEQAIARNPKDPRARFYLAIGREQDGDKKGALTALTALIADAPAGAEWTAGVRTQAAAIAKDLGLDPAKVLPPPDAAATGAPTPGPNAGDPAAIAKMSPDQQRVMIRSMVGKLAARLESAPDDAQGWRMLGRSYDVLGEPAKAADAFGRAAALMPDDAGLQVDYVAALLNASGSGQPPPEAVDRLEKIVARDPANTSALYYLGEVRRRQGDTAEAARLWQRLLAQLPAESEDHAWLKTQLEALQVKD